MTQTRFTIDSSSYRMTRFSSARIPARARSSAGFIAGYLGGLPSGGRIGEIWGRGLGRGPDQSAGTTSSA